MLHVGEKVKVHRSHIAYAIERSLEGVVTSVDSIRDLVRVDFRLTRQQVIDTGWSHEMRDGSMYVVRRSYNPDSLVLASKSLTAAEQREIAELRAKAVRSPVEEYILFGLEF